MKLVTWNVNGLRACMNKGFKESMENWTPISSLSRKRRCSGNRPALTFPAIMNIGTVPLKRLLRNGHLFPDQAPFRDLWSGHRGT